MGIRMNDDFNWNTYSYKSYIRQLIIGYRDKECDFFISTDGLYHSEAGLEFKDRIHNNSKEIYWLVDKLKPKSILECGCGACIQLKNLRLVLPEAELYGIDISSDQIEMGRWFAQLPKDILQNVSVMDITATTPDRKFDFVFTQAVIMHMSQERAVRALTNMKNISNKYVYLIENKYSHKNWEDLVKSVFVGWDFSHPGRFIDEGILLTKND